MTEQKVYKVLVVGCSRDFFEFFVDNNYCRRLITRIKNRKIQSGVIRFEYLGTVFRFYHGSNVASIRGNKFSRVITGDSPVEVNQELWEYIDGGYLGCARRQILTSYGSPAWKEKKKANLERRKISFLGELGT